MKIKVITPAPVKPKLKIEVTLNDEETRALHKLIGKFSNITLADHFELDDASKEFIRLNQIFDNIFGGIAQKIDENE